MKYGLGGLDVGLWENGWGERVEGVSRDYDMDFAGM